MIAALDCCRDDLAWVSVVLFFSLSFLLFFFPLSLLSLPSGSVSYLLLPTHLKSHPSQSRPRLSPRLPDAKMIFILPRYITLSVLWKNYLLKIGSKEWCGRTWEIDSTESALSCTELSGSQLYWSLNVRESFFSFPVFFFFPSLLSFTAFALSSRVFRKYWPSIQHWRPCCFL